MSLPSADPALAPSDPPADPASRVARFVAMAGGLLVTALALLITVSVSLRYLTSNGINGDFELVQTGLAVAVFAFLPLCQARRGNIMVDTFTGRLPRSVQRGLDAIWDLVYAGFAGFIAWRLAIGAMEAFSSRTTSMVLALPIGYAIAGCAALAAFLAVICIHGALTVAGRGRP